MSSEPYFEPLPLAKRCSLCRTWYAPPLEDHFYRKWDRPTKDGSPRFESQCKRCRDAYGHGREGETTKLLRKARTRARYRAWVRLGREYPERMAELYLEELIAEGWDGDEDLRKGANRRRGNRTYVAVRCRSRQKCGWKGDRKASTGKATVLPCPWCGGKVERRL